MSSLADDLKDDAKTDAREAARIKKQERWRRAARKELDAEERGPRPVPPILSLRERLEKIREPIAWRIEGFQKVGQKILLAAQFKAGKTTLVINLVKALLDNAPFLGAHAVTAVEKIILLDFEMATEEPCQIDDWYRAAGVANDDRLVIVPLRGRAGAFNILDDAVFAEWVERLRGAAYVILDCLRPLMDALGLDENHEAGLILGAFDALLIEAGVKEALVIQHAGHTNNRARGDSRLLDWPDATWMLVRANENPASDRFISAYGRDVDVPEAQLGYDPATRALTIVGGSRRDVKAEAALVGVLQLLKATGAPMVGGDIAKDAALLVAHGRDVIRRALKLGVKNMQLTETSGPTNNTKLYTPYVAVNDNPF
jgi:hypothetical protein